jgi:hypothetical protein
MSSVLVEVSHGLASVVAKPTDTEVEVIDLDQLREGAYEDVRRYWEETLSARARKHVRGKYPQVASRLET